MKNFSVWSIRLLTTLFFVSFWAGCAGTSSFKIAEPRNEEQVLQSLLNYPTMLQAFVLNTDLTLTLAKDTMRLSGNVNYTTPDLWYITIDGPLGMDMVRMVLDGNIYQVTIPQLGQSFTGDLRDSEALQTQGIQLPEFNLFPVILMPMPYLDPAMDWQLSPKSSHQSRKIDIFDHKSETKLEIHYAVNPFRVLSESREKDGKLQYVRDFSYEGNSRIPKMITVSLDGGTVIISARSWEFDWVKAA